MKISIVTAYYNRKKLFINTLNSIKKTLHDDFEVIVVDDASNEENRLEDLKEEYDFLNVIRINPEDKWWINPCIPFNIGFKHIKGDFVILQNPECFHTKDIIKYVADNITENDYFSFGCYSLNKDKTNRIEEFESFTFENRGVSYDGEDSWYNHSKYRPVGYHFTSAISKRKLNLLNGFDERFANGLAYDDNEFLYRINKICNFKFIDDPFVLHQNHYNEQEISEEKKIINLEFIEKNKILYNNIILNKIN
jgi:glycosyltransferase involved in cell wall biosynthesis